MTTLDFFEKFLIPLVSAGIGAILAFRYQHTLELNREKRYILQTLMMYRNVGANELDWIKALNAIDVVYHDNKKIRELLHTFFAQTMEPHYGNLQWVETLYQMIYLMAQSSGYKHLTLHEIRTYYDPKALDLHYPNRNIQKPPIDTA
ncbi:hypothetical protein BCY91_07220 [Pelobium manganitolerans]|uniref:DUF6680 domain-containing protein n=1 Tax=Pelobium manganitolerans TaxID=1842495 RepID=A0A419S3P7_9SPHI|nr:DUF6680 family protein [Pelobium manganitolerans]RKD14273.1 hypothetical protein BCY91_07220 [Pelobium manganitolerans]